MQSMTVAELIEMLEDMDPEAEVRIAQQPSWPFEYSIKDVVETGGEQEADEKAENGEAEQDREELPKVVYLVEDEQLGYLPGYVARRIGWRE